MRRRSTDVPYRPISACRLCRKRSLVSVLDLGLSSLTGIFAQPDDIVPTAPLELVWCADCTLLQLRHSLEPSELYGDNYGYRSGLNASMVRHLRAKADRLATLTDLQVGDTVLDIGCNDGTLLAGYAAGVSKIGVDPTVDKFRQHHAADIHAVADFFSASVYDGISEARARIITSIAMFYDLEDPVTFTREVAACLAYDGVWHFEQSYMPAMLRTGSYDTVCHEHLEYYSLANIVKLLDVADLEPISVRFNSVNGGSFSVTAGHRGGPYKPEHDLIEWFIGQERRLAIHTPAPFRHFEERVFRHRADLFSLLDTLADSGARCRGLRRIDQGKRNAAVCGPRSQALVGHC